MRAASASSSLSHGGVYFFPPFLSFFLSFFLFLSLYPALPSSPFLSATEPADDTSTVLFWLKAKNDTTLLTASTSPCQNQFRPVSWPCSQCSVNLPYLEEEKQKGKKKKESLVLIVAVSCRSPTVE